MNRTAAWVACLTVVLVCAGLTPANMTAQTRTLHPQTAGRFAGLALDCVHREYPNKIGHVLHADGDARPPRELTPAFFGCCDWHSSVHAHWLLARLVRLVGDADFADDARRALNRSLTAKNIESEVRYLSGDGRTTFERPYGLAWLLQLVAELREWEQAGADTHGDVGQWRSALGPLEALAARRFETWLPSLSYPIRSGEHSQTAFAFGLVLDWTRTAEHAGELQALLRSRIETYYRADRDCPLGYEPSGQDFLSPCLAEADLMRRVLDPPTFADWLATFLPGIPVSEPYGDWLPLAVVTDPTDAKIVHLDGLNLSRAWMLEGIAEGLPASDSRRPALLESAHRHAESGLASVTGEYYEGGHWLASFATYLVSKRGLSYPNKTFIPVG